jgi:hypothetical protein
LSFLVLKRVAGHRPLGSEYHGRQARQKIGATPGKRMAIIQGVIEIKVWERELETFKRRGKETPPTLCEQF